MLDAVAMELGITSETIQVSINNALAVTPNIQPCEACAKLTDTASLLRDPVGTQAAMDAVAQVFNDLADIAPLGVAFTPEMGALITSAIDERINDSQTPHYATAMEYIDLFAEYISVLDNELGSPVGNSMAFVMEKYGTTITDSDNSIIIAYVLMRLENISG